MPSQVSDVGGRALNVPARSRGRACAPGASTGLFVHAPLSRAVSLRRCGDGAARDPQWHPTACVLASGALGCRGRWEALPLSGKREEAVWLR